MGLYCKWAQKNDAVRIELPLDVNGPGWDRSDAFDVKQALVTLGVDGKWALLSLHTEWELVQLVLACFRMASSISTKHPTSWLRPLRPRQEEVRMLEEIEGQLLARRPSMSAECGSTSETQERAQLAGSYRANQIALVDTNMHWLTCCLQAAKSTDPMGWSKLLLQCPLEHREAITKIVANYVTSLF